MQQCTSVGPLDPSQVHSESAARACSDFSVLSTQARNSSALQDGLAVRGRRALDTTARPRSGCTMRSGLQRSCQAKG